MRNVERHFVQDKNSLQHLYRTVSLWRVIYNFLLISLARVSPSLSFKNLLYRCVGIKIGKNVSVGLMVMMDVLHPQMIRIGDNSVIGYNTTILGHEYLVDEWRVGPVEIGKNVMIGANCTILPGIRIGDNAVISACSLINRNIPAGAFAGGIPVRLIIKKGKSLGGKNKIFLRKV